jgi:hypothetical protein
VQNKKEQHGVGEILVMVVVGDACSWDVPLIWTRPSGPHLAFWHRSPRGSLRDFMGVSSQPPHSHFSITVWRDMRPSNPKTTARAPKYRLLQRTKNTEGFIKLTTPDGEKHTSIARLVAERLPESTHNEWVSSYAVGEQAAKHVTSEDPVYQLESISQHPVPKEVARQTPSTAEQTHQHMENCVRARRSDIEDLEVQIARQQEALYGLRKRLATEEFKAKCVPQSKKRKSLLSRSETQFVPTSSSAADNRNKEGEVTEFGQPLFRAGICELLSSISAELHRDPEKTMNGVQRDNVVDWPSKEDLFEALVSHGATSETLFNAQLTVEAVEDYVCRYVGKNAPHRNVTSAATLSHHAAAVGVGGHAAPPPFDCAVTDHALDIGVICIPVGIVRHEQPKSEGGILHTNASRKKGRRDPPKCSKAATPAPSNTNPGHTSIPHQVCLEYITDGTKHMSIPLQEGHVYVFSPTLFHRYRVHAHTTLRLLTFRVHRKNGKGTNQDTQQVVTQ